MPRCKKCSEWYPEGATHICDSDNPDKKVDKEDMDHVIEVIKESEEYRKRGGNYTSLIDDISAS